MAPRGLAALALAAHGVAVVAGAPTRCSMWLGTGQCGLVDGSNYTCAAGFWCSKHWFCGPADTHKMQGWEQRTDFSDDADGACSGSTVPSGSTPSPGSTLPPGSTPSPDTTTSKGLEKPGPEGEPRGSFLVPATLAVLVFAGVAVAAGLAWQVRRHRKQSGAAGPGGDVEQPSTNMQAEVRHARSDVEPNIQTEGIPATNPHLSVQSSMWCVTPKQFFEFIEEVHQRYPDEDPTAHKVVEEMIKPRTRDATVSYALLQNPQGVPVKHFITHAWDEGVKSFGAALRKVDLTGGLWICFLANPQTWPREQLYNLLTPVWSSPFASALREATSVIVVRNSNVNMYTRLWCVFELYIAVTWNKPLVVVGPPPDEAALTGAGVGFDANCSDGRDRATLRLAMREHVAEVNRAVGTVMRQQPML